MRAQGGEGRLGDLPSLCSSEESLISLFPFTDDDDDENYESVPVSSTPARTAIGPKNKFQSTELLPEILPTRDVAASKGSSSSAVCFNDVSAIAESTFNEAFSSRHRSEDSLTEPKEVETTALSRATLSPPKSNGAKFGESSPRPYWTEPSLSASLSLITELSSGEKLPKEEINARLKELALTSESGSCTVLEVIEPSSEDSDTHPEEERRATEVQMGNPIHSVEDSTSESTKTMPGPRPNQQERRGKRLTGRLRQEETEAIGKEANTSNDSAAEYLSSNEQQQPNEASYASSDGKHFLVNETSVVTAAVDVSDKGQRSHESTGENKDSVLGTSASRRTPLSTTFASPSASTSETLTTTGAAAVTFKRKGFLHKLIKPPRWPSKRKVKNLRKFDPENTRELLDPYPPHRGNRSSGYSLADGDPHTTPESNTSSSQEYSNSSEESSIGKPTSSTSSRPTELFQSYTGHKDPDNKTNSCLVSNAPHEAEKKTEKLTPHMIPLSTVGSPSRSSSSPPLQSLRAILSTTPSDTSLNTQGYHSDERIISVKGIENIQKNSVTEIRSIATSDDSGIVGRPASSASKSDNSVSRPESSSSTFPPFKSDYSLQKSSLSLTQDMLPIPDSSAAGRMSPAPSEVSKTESALSPPSHASDVFKSESSRQTSMGKGSTNSNSSKNGSAVSSDYSVTLLPLKKDLNVKTAAIINISCDQKNKKPLQDDLCEDPVVSKSRVFSLYSIFILK